MHSETEVLTGSSTDGSQLFVRPVGPCTAKTAGAIQQQLPSLIGREVKVVLFDLSDVAAVDSTFIGLLLLLRRDTGDHNPHLRLAGVTEPVRQALESMHLLALFDFCERGKAEPTDWTHLAGEVLSAEQLGETVLRAHESIVEADGRNTAEFGRVIEAFGASKPPDALDAD